MVASYSVSQLQRLELRFSSEAATISLTLRFDNALQSPTWYWCWYTTLGAADGDDVVTGATGGIAAVTGVI
jgi:hypothetical protein